MEIKHDYEKDAPDKGRICDEERAAILALNTIFGFSPEKGRAILDHLEDARDIFHFSRNELMQAGIRREEWLQSLRPARLEEAYRELEKLDRLHARFLTIKDAAYPALLKECPDAPAGLYIKSKDRPEEIFRSDRPAIAIVGTRDISSYGTEICVQLVRTLARMTPQPLIVSGLALGVDVVAHRTALEYHLPTIAVMATGIEAVYPFSHGWTAQQMTQADGSGLLTDYPLGTQPKAVNFVRRNRILAGMSQATVLIESKPKGGGMITGRLAASYNRDLYAVPGRIHDLRSQGCNLLISQNLAIPLVDLEKFPTDLGFAVTSQVQTEHLLAAIRKRYQTHEEANYLQQLLAIARIIQRETEISKAELADQCHLDYSDLSFLTGLLESDGFISTDLLDNCSIQKDFM